MQQIRDTIATEFDAVNQLIVDNLHSDVPLVENIGQYIVEAGGKRLRPMLVLLSGGCCGKINADHITLAAVIEFIHTATLLHDDVVDISSLRRGRPTANAEWGNAPSVLVGDFLYTRAFQLLVAIGNMELMALMADTTNAIAEGEVLQLAKAGDASTTEDDYFQVIKNKTSVLFAAAASGAAILSGANQSTAQALYQYGLNLGNAFQLIDDVLDYEGDARAMGKNVGDDLAEGKPTLPLIYTLSGDNTKHKQLISTAIESKSKQHLSAIITAVRESGGIHYTRQCAQDYAERASNDITRCPESSHKQALQRLTSIAVARDA